MAIGPTKATDKVTWTRRLAVSVSDQSPRESKLAISVRRSALSASRRRVWVLSAPESPCRGGLGRGACA